ncbi:Nucleoporin nup35 [Dimargaris cristalligena]|uniref:RRM Nup35-type domain-containing protein n=1 Tax=Dimargaris cristalligena TaxID=215637 RepID=A0A4P9ZYA9_9FUNG|nr:Nucleoporin nup35 [Dimargaris cristalligena]RKP38686.1 hypothetical protein BJ085DRAFT_41369 [Dimargaris cristalligena]|eukprot:RKP38686.1 hypothetical protein BJ085DRAFT_41369 [Dimargaris cristalligena]
MFNSSSQTLFSTSHPRPAASPRKQNPLAFGAPTNDVYSNPGHPFSSSFSKRDSSLYTHSSGGRMDSPMETDPHSAGQPQYLPSYLLSGFAPPAASVGEYSPRTRPSPSSRRSLALTSPEPPTESPIYTLPGRGPIHVQRRLSTGTGFGHVDMLNSRQKKQVHMDQITVLGDVPPSTTLDDLDQVRGSRTYTMSNPPPPASEAKQEPDNRIPEEFAQGKMYSTVPVETLEKTGFKVTVFGFPPGSALEVFRYFSQFGNITTYSLANPDANYITLVYSLPGEASRALSCNGTLISNNTMVAVVPSNAFTAPPTLASNGPLAPTAVSNPGGAPGFLRSLANHMTSPSKSAKNASHPVPTAPTPFYAVPPELKYGNIPGFQDPITTNPPVSQASQPPSYGQQAPLISLFDPPPPASGFDLLPPGIRQVSSTLTVNPFNPAPPVISFARPLNNADPGQSTNGTTAPPEEESSQCAPTDSPPKSRGLRAPPPPSSMRGRPNAPPPPSAPMSIQPIQVKPPTNGVRDEKPTNYPRNSVLQNAIDMIFGW